MKALIRIKKNKLNIGYQQLAKIIWQVPQDKFFVSHIGGDETLQKEYWLKIWPDFTDLFVDWCKVPFIWGATPVCIAPGKEAKNTLVVYSDHLNELTVTKMAFYNLVKYLAKELDGVIQERDSDMWITAEAFMDKHRDIMQLSLDDAVGKSIEEAQTLQAIDEDDDLFSL